MKKLSDVPAYNLSKVECDMCGEEFYYDGWEGDYYNSDGEQIDYMDNEVVQETGVFICSQDCYDELLDNLKRRYKSRIYD